VPKKKFQVIKATTREIPGLLVGGREKKFAANGTFETNDPGEAAEIDKVLGMKGTGEVVVTDYTEKEHGHNYTFTGVDTSHLKRDRDNGKVWAWVGRVQKLVKREEAIQNGYQIVSKRRRQRASVRREVTQ
jgi:hypothetical protein